MSASRPAAPTSTPGELTAREINQRFAHRSSAFVSALLATLPGVQYKLEPIRLLFRPARGTGQ